MTSVQKSLSNEQARFNMIEQQIRTWEVLDPNVLQLLHKVPREHFVPEAYQGLAFADIEIPLIDGQSMLSPKLEARILQSLAIKPSDQVLHIGTGSGYFTALLANMAAHVYSVEINAELSATAAYKLAEHDIHNVTIELGNGIDGLKAHQPYNVIVLTRSSPVEPLNLRDQLAIGGSLFVVLGSAPAMEATLITRVSETGFNKQVIFETCLPELENAPQGNTFSF